MDKRTRLQSLTDRWRVRRDARRTPTRPPADGDREELARRSFPYRESTPAAYVEEHGADMIGFTYDEARYADPQLDAWLVEVGRLLRMNR